MTAVNHLPAAVALFLSLHTGVAGADSRWNWLPPPEPPLPSPDAGSLLPPVTSLDTFVSGDVRDRAGGPLELTRAIVQETNNVTRFFQLLQVAVDFNQASADVLIDSGTNLLRALNSPNQAPAVLNGPGFGAAGVDISAGAGFLFNAGVALQIFAVDPFALSIELSGPLSSAGNVFLDSAGDQITIASDVAFTTDGFTIERAGQPLTFFGPGSAVFHGLNTETAGDFDARNDGFIVGAANTVSATAENNVLAGFTQGTTLTGDCSAGCSYADNDASAIEAVEIGYDGKHGVSWALILPPASFNDGAARTVNGAMAYITANDLTPRSQLPDSGIATYDNVIGGASPFHPTRGAGSLNAFSATVDFSTAQVTALALSGSFGAGDSFTASAGGGPAPVAANGSFSAPLTGSCSFCGGGLSGSFAGGFVSGGDAMIGAYGLRRATLPGSRHSIVGSVIATR